MQCMKWLCCLIVAGWLLPAQAVVSTLVADTKSGFILESQNATVQQPPASLTKLMTLYLLFGALNNGVVRMDDPLLISENAAAQPKSNLGLVPGETITVREALLALIIKSANDVAVVIAEALGQDESRFADMMTQTAKGIGLRDTIFKNASGLHIKGQVSTARDMAILTMALISHYPQYYALFATPSFTYKGQTYHSHNVVLQQYEGAEGLKTGFVSAVGYNIISTAKQNDSRLVSIVIGETSPLKRDLRAMRLLDKGFRQVAIQKKAQEGGRLNGAFNPLNRRAFISKPPIATFLPTMKACVAMGRKKANKIVKNKQVAKIYTARDVVLEQGDQWSIQVGAFEGKDKARRIAEEAMEMLGINNKTVQTPKADDRYFRSRIQGFSKNEATDACRQLKDAKWQCFTVAPHQG